MNDHRPIDAERGAVEVRGGDGGCEARVHHRERILERDRIDDQRAFTHRG